MPFGKYKGTMIQDVPANYLHFLWTKSGFRDMTRTSNVADYIGRNIHVLKKEYPDGIWD